MIPRLIRRFKTPSSDSLTSQLYNEQTFYRAFERDLARCQNEAVIESPFITTRRTEILLPVLRKMIAHGARVTVNTRHPQEHEGYLRTEAGANIALLQRLGVVVLFTGGHHRKLAIIDRQILYEGSLNILSQNDSCEVMRRIDSQEFANQMIAFLSLNKFL